MTRRLIGRQTWPTQKETLQAVDKLLSKSVALYEELYDTMSIVMRFFIQRQGDSEKYKYGDQDVHCVSFAVQHLMQAREALSDYEQHLIEAKAHLNCISDQLKEED